MFMSNVQRLNIYGPGMPYLENTPFLFSTVRDRWLVSSVKIYNSVKSKKDTKHLSLTIKARYGRYEFNPWPAHIRRFWRFNKKPCKTYFRIARWDILITSTNSIHFNNFCQATTYLVIIIFIRFCRYLIRLIIGVSYFSIFHLIVQIENVLQWSEKWFYDWCLNLACGNRSNGKTIKLEKDLWEAIFRQGYSSFTTIVVCMHIAKINYFYCKVVQKDIKIRSDLNMKWMLIK